MVKSKGITSQKITMIKYGLIVFTVVFFTGCFVNANKNFASDMAMFKINAKKYLGDNEVLVSSWYNYAISKRNNGDYIFRTFHPEKQQITSEATYSTKKMKVRNGFAGAWYDSGNKKAEGHFLMNKKEGHWKYYFYKDNLIDSEGKYESGKEVGIWKYYRNKGKLSEEISYANGVKEGGFFEYDTLGGIRNQGIYKADTIFEQTNPPLAYPLDEHMPYMSVCHEVEGKKERTKCSGDAMLKYIYETIKYPSFAREYGIQGNAVVRFKINKEGQVVIVETLSGICESIEKECLRIISGMPNWKPGMQNGKEVEVYFNLPIRFTLE